MSKSLQIIVENVATSYSDEGNGPVIIFVHGWLDSKETFNELVRELKTNYRCISIDLPNFGASQTSEEIITLEDYAQYLRSFIDKLKLQEYALVGHSMGGQISIYASGKGILQPKKIVLIAAAGIRSRLSVVKWFLRMIAKPFRIMPRKIKNQVYKTIGSDYNADLSVIHKAVIKEVITHDVQEQAQLITAPTLLMYGEVDRHTTVAMGKIIQSNIKQSQLITFPQQNHWVHQAVSKEVARNMKDFLK